MNELPVAVGVDCTARTLEVVLSDGRTLSVPLVWFPRLAVATPDQRRNWRLVGTRHGDLVGRPGRGHLGRGVAAERLTGSSDEVDVIEERRQRCSQGSWRDRARRRCLPLRSAGTRPRRLSHRARDRPPMRPATGTCESRPTATSVPQGSLSYDHPRRSYDLYDPAGKLLPRRRANQGGRNGEAPVTLALPPGRYVVASMLARPTARFRSRSHPARPPRFPQRCWTSAGRVPLIPGLAPRACDSTAHPPSV